MIRKNVLYLIIAAQILTLILFVILLKPNNNIAVSGLSEMKSDRVEYDGTWHADEDLEGAENGMILMYGPGTTLARGYYEIVIDYNCSSEQTVNLSGERGETDNAYIKGDDFKLDPRIHSVVYDFSVSEIIPKFHLLINYDGTGAMDIYDVNIYRTKTGYKRIVIILLLGYFAMDLLIFGRKWLIQNKTSLILLGGVVFLVICPLFSDGINVGHNLEFHLMRIEGIVYELKEGHFPARMESLWMNGYGYPVSIYYGDFLLYFPALLRLFGFTITEAYKMYIVLITILGVMISYFMFMKVFSDQRIALVTTMVYYTSTYRLVDIYEKAAVGEYTAMIFLPVVAGSVYLIIKDKGRNIQWGNAIMLALGMTGIIESHVLSTEMVLIALVIFCAIEFKCLIKPGVLKTVIVSVVFALSLNMAFIIPFLDYIINVDTKISSDMSSGRISLFQSSGSSFITQYFDFFSSPFDALSASEEISDRYTTTPGLALLVGLFIGLYYLFRRKADRRIAVSLGLSLFYLYLSSNLFPWDFLINHSTIGRILSSVQFSWRYITIAILTMTFLVGFILEMEYEKYAKLLCLLTLLTSLVFISNYSEDSYCKNYRDTRDLNLYEVINGEYLRSSLEVTDTWGLSTDVTSEGAETQLRERHGSDFTVLCKASEKGGSVHLPVFNYKGYKAFSDNGMEFELVDGLNSEAVVVIPSGYSGNIMFSFIEPWYWRLSELISLVSYFLIVVIVFLRNFKNSNVHNTVMLD